MKTPIKDLFPPYIRKKLQQFSDNKQLDILVTYQEIADWAVLVPKLNAAECSHSLVLAYRQPWMLENSYIYSTGYAAIERFTCSSQPVHIKNLR